MAAPAQRARSDAAYALGQGIAQSGYGLFFGGGSLGIMGAVCDGALDAGGYVTGVIIDFLKSEERVLKTWTDYLRSRPCDSASWGCSS